MKYKPNPLSQNLLTLIKRYCIRRKTTSIKQISRKKKNNECNDNFKAFRIAVLLPLHQMLLNRNAQQITPIALMRLQQRRSFQLLDPEQRNDEQVIFS